MKVAIPTNDGHSVSEHLSHSRTFQVYEVVRATADAPPVVSLLEERTSAQPKQGGGGGGGCAAHGGGGSVHHAAVLSALHGVDAVICGNLGLGLLRDLEFMGADVYPALEGTIDEAIALFATGSLRADYSRVCRCGR